MSGSPGLNPSDAVAQPLVVNRAGDDLPGGDVGIAFGKNIKPASRGESWNVFHDELLLGVLGSAFQPDDLCGRFLQHMAALACRRIKRDYHVLFGIHLRRKEIR